MNWSLLFKRDNSAPVACERLHILLAHDTLDRDAPDRCVLVLGQCHDASHHPGAAGEDVARIRRPPPVERAPEIMDANLPAAFVRGHFGDAGC